MTRSIEYFAFGVLALCELLMRGVGAVDQALGQVMTTAGLDPERQVLVLLGLTVVLVVLALRFVGGFLGWVVLILAVLLLLHRIVPGVAGPGSMLTTPLETAL